MAEELEDKLRRLTAARSVAEEDAAEQRYLETSRQRLLKIVQRKNATGFIGALAKFEQHIGVVLWGHGKPDSECTPDQLAWRQVWEQCRAEILNNGNNQQRAVENEFALYTVRWNRYVTTLPVAAPAPGVKSSNPNSGTSQER